jgi:protein phosphatase-4 regulatory subunit 3
VPLLYTPARHILRQDLLEPVMTAFFDNGERYNLLNSAVLDLVEFIRKENIKVLMEHLVRVWGHRFDEVTYVDTFRLLRLKWEQGAEGGGAGSGGPAASGDQDAVGSGGGRGGRDRR